MVLNRTSECNVYVSYLYINISIFANIFLTNLYNNRDNFDFTIVNFPFKNHNIPPNPSQCIYLLVG